MKRQKDDTFKKDDKTRPKRDKEAVKKEARLDNPDQGMYKYGVDPEEIRNSSHK